MFLDALTMESSVSVEENQVLLRDWINLDLNLDQFSSLSREKHHHMPDVLDLDVFQCGLVGHRRSGLPLCQVCSALELTTVSHSHKIADTCLFLHMCLSVMLHSVCVFVFVCVCCVYDILDR